MQSVLKTVFSFLALLVLVSCSRGESAEQPASKTIPIKTGEVRRVQQREFVSVSGTVTSPDAAVPVSFLVSGKVIKVGFREGDYVKQGQLLAAIDPTDYMLSLQIATAEAEEAKIALDRSKDEYARMKFLYESKALSENDFKKFKAAWLRAQQQVNLTTANQQLAKKHLSDASLYAPATGFISRRSIEPGQTASPGSPVFEIVKLDPVEINVGVP
ncbi:MAG: efflux RND transporter periplasmic adaptor subunit, partial [Desulfobacterales bacterium]